MNPTFLVIATGLLLASGLAAQNGLAVSWSGQATSIDPSTGAGTTLGATGFSRMDSLARDPASGTYYTVSRNGNAILAVNPSTGTATSVATSTLPDVRGLSFDPNGTLYAIANGHPDSLWALDPTTGVSSLIGATNHRGIRGLAYDSFSGTLYGWDVGSGPGPGDGLITISTTHGMSVNVNSSVYGRSGNDIQSLAFDASGALYGARSQLFLVDVATGVTTLVGGSGYSDVRGLDFPGGPMVQEFQVNSAEATYLLNGVSSPGFIPANVSSTTGSTVTWSLSSSVAGGAMYEVGFTTAPLFPQSAGTLTFPNGDLLHLDITAPDLVLLNQGFSLPVPPLTSAQGSFVPTAPVQLTTQLVTINPATPGGFNTSQALELDVN